MREIQRDDLVEKLQQYQNIFMSMEDREFEVILTN